MDRYIDQNGKGAKLISRANTYIVRKTNSQQAVIRQGGVRGGVVVIAEERKELTAGQRLGL